MKLSEFQETRLRFAQGNTFYTFVHACLIFILIENMHEYRAVLEGVAPMLTWLFFIVLPFWYLVQAATNWLSKRDVRKWDQHHGYDPNTGDFSS